MAVELRASIDLTVLFKSCVKTIKMRNKALGIPFPQSQVFPSITRQFFSRARDIQASISCHDILINDHKNKYLADDPGSLTDIERNYMDKVATTNLKIIDDSIRSLELEIREEHRGDVKSQAFECKLNVINILRANYLNTNALFRKLKDQRQKKQKEKEQLFRLQRPTGLANKKPLLCSDSFNKRNSSHHILTEDKDTQSCNKDHRINCDESCEKLKKGISAEIDTISTTNIAEDGSPSKTENSETREKKSHNKSSYLEEVVDDMLMELGSEERQALEEENSHLFQELMSNQEEVRQITRQVVELSKMQDILTENVEIQAHQIDQIHETILGATDNIQEGNEQVREAMRRDAGFRVWIMFFLIVMSFTVLFLDWYNA